MKTVRKRSLIVASALLGAFSVGACGTSDQTRSDAQPAKALNSRIGELKYENGFPTQETVDKLYNELDFQSAVLAYQYATPLVAYNELNLGLKQISVDPGDVAVAERFLQPAEIALTGNNNTIYGQSFLDLAASHGPLVVEMPAGLYGAFFDLWQRPIGQIGPAGPDKGKGGKFVVVPSDFTDPIPAGYIPIKSSTTLAAVFVRAFVRNNDVAAAAKSLDGMRIYSLAQRNNPPKTEIVPFSGKKFNSIAPRGLAYWERVADILNRLSPADQDGAFLESLLKPLGIERGKAFQPDARQKQILTDASVLGWAMSQAISMASRSKDAIYYQGTRWEFVLNLDPSLRQEFWRDLEARTAYYWQGTMAAPAMKVKDIGVGSQYLQSARDSSGNWLDGGKQYRLHVPANPPAKEFWSVTVYDYETRSMIQTDTNIPARSSADKLIKNGDGSVDLYFGPTAPAGKEANWVKTIPGRGWWVWFRFYGPTEPFFDKSWKLADFEKVS